MPSKELAVWANIVAKKGNDPKKRLLHHISHEYMNSDEVFDSVTGTVVYVGSGQELSSLFLFPNASILIHQDVDPKELQIPLSLFQEAGIISHYFIESESSDKQIHKFRLEGKEKTLIEVAMDIEEGVPEEARSNLEAIYFFGVPYRRVIRNLQRKLLPSLKIGGLFEGPYPYSDGAFEGALPEELGLEQLGNTFVKVRNVSYEEIVAVHRNNPYFALSGIPDW